MRLFLPSNTGNLLHPLGVLQYQTSVTFLFANSTLPPKYLTKI